MAKKEETAPTMATENAQQQPIESTTPNRDAWRAGIMKKNPNLGENPSDEDLYAASMSGYDTEHEQNKKNQKDNGMLYEALQRSPEFAGVVSKLANPEEGQEPGEEFLALGEDLVDLLTGKIDAPKFREGRQAKRDAEAKKAELDKAAGEAYTKACETLGIDPEETMGKLLDKYGTEDKKGFLADERFYTALIQSLTRDEDIEAAEARGRGAQIATRKETASAASDGIARSTAGSAATPKTTNPNSLAAIGERRRQAAM